MNGNKGSGRIEVFNPGHVESARTHNTVAVSRVLAVSFDHAELVEEAPLAYRDIVEVVEDEVDLVRPVIRLEPLAVLKG